METMDEPERHTHARAPREPGTRVTGAGTPTAIGLVALALAACTGGEGQREVQRQNAGLESTAPQASAHAEAGVSAAPPAIPAAIPTAAPTPESDAAEAQAELPTDSAPNEGLRVLFCASLEQAVPIEACLELAETALSSLSDSKPTLAPSGGWTHRVDWPDESVQVSATALPAQADGARVVEVRFDIAKACSPDQCPQFLAGVLQIFLRWKADTLAECTVIAQLEVPGGEEFDTWIELAASDGRGARRKGAFVQCYVDRPSQRQTIELRLERTPSETVRESKFSSPVACDCGLIDLPIDGLRNLCRALRQGD
jgi:hypothetical protein